MSIAMTCGHCEHSFHVNDQWVGKRIKCPKCHEQINVSAAGDGQALSDFMQWAAGGATANNGVNDDTRWFLQTSTGRQYGPVERKLLDYWLRLGAVSARSQVLREGDTQWRWATELYPQLGQG